MNPDEAWAALTRQLQLEMPKATFEERLGAARPVSFDNQVFTIAVPDAYTRDWLENRLTGMLERRLGGIANADAAVRFVVDGGQVSRPNAAEHRPSANGSKPDDGQAAAAFRPIQSDLHKIITRPHAQTVVPAYFLRWLPYIGPDGGWFLVAMYQAFYFSANARVSQENQGAVFRVNRSWLRTWSGLGTNKIASLLEATSRASDGSFISWFIKGTQPEKGRAREYCFLVDMPLTPGDMEALTSWLVAHGIQKDPVAALREAVNTPVREILPFPIPPPAAHHYALPPGPTTVIELVHRLSTGSGGQQEIRRLARQLQSNILPPNDNLFITHYFLRNWVKRLKPGPAWVVMILRDKGFQDSERGILRDRVQLQNGYQELSRVLGVSEERISDWLPPLADRVRPRSKDGAAKRSWRYQQDNRQRIGAFIVSKEAEFDTSGSLPTKYAFRIRLEDPLIPAHASIARLIEAVLWQRLQAEDTAISDGFLAILKETINSRRPGVEIKQLQESATGGPGVEIKQLPISLEWNLNSLSSGWGGFRAALPDPGVDFKQLLEWTPRGIKDSLKLFDLKVLYEIQQLLLQTCSDRYERDAGVGGWTVDFAMQLMTMGGLQPEKCAQLRGHLESQPHKLSRLVGWILHGYTNKTSASRKGIDAPELYAAARFEKSAPQPVYQELAEKPIGKLFQLLQDPYSQHLSKSQTQILSSAGENGLLDVLKIFVEAPNV